MFPPSQWVPYGDIDLRGNLNWEGWVKGLYNCSSSIESLKQASYYHDYCVTDAHAHGSSDITNNDIRSLPNVGPQDYCFDSLTNVLSERLLNSMLDQH